MTTISINAPRRGRPKKSPIAMLKTQVWFQAVSLISGKSAYQLEKYFHPEQVRRGESWVIRPRRWDRYRNGVMEPKDVMGGLIDQVEAVAPSSAYWFRMPLWKAIETIPLSQEQIDAQLMSLEAEVMTVLFMPKTEFGQARHPFGDKESQQLIEIGSFDALAAAILLVRESETLRSAELRTLVLATYRALQQSIAECPPLQTLHGKLFNYLDSAFPEELFVHKNKRMDVVVFTKGYWQVDWPKNDDIAPLNEVTKKTLTVKESPHVPT
ncbi:MAG: hypothetical protein Q7S87_15515 [Agitococcus sp.]|nr:hypothetical protein [Agitococcus sp.]